MRLLGHHRNGVMVHCLADILGGGGVGVGNGGGGDIGGLVRL